ncbi:hypothetical protein BT63DRAFT_426230, partial [Microthyrium microscopicum]
MAPQIYITSNLHHLKSISPQIYTTSKSYHLKTTSQHKHFTRERSRFFNLVSFTTSTTNIYNPPSSHIHHIPKDITNIHFQSSYSHHLHTSNNPYIAPCLNRN